MQYETVKKAQAEAQARQQGEAGQQTNFNQQQVNVMPPSADQTWAHTPATFRTCRVPSSQWRHA